MPRLDRLPQINRNNLLTFPAQVNDGAPFVAPTKPLAECRLAIVTTAGLHRRGGRLFGPGDQTYRVIPSATPTVDIVQSHTSLGFDRTAIMRDLNISFPIDRVRELVARGELSGLAPHFYSFMGAQRDAWPPRGCRLGLPHNYLLEVRGRRTGRVYSTPVNVLDLTGKRYLVAPRGRTPWVRNAEVTGDVALKKGWSSQRFRVRPVPSGEKPAILSAYLDRFRPTVQRYFPVPPGSGPEAFAKLVDRYPVFEVLPSG